jgi:hypothetical protein
VLACARNPEAALAALAEAAAAAPAVMATTAGPVATAHRWREGYCRLPHGVASASADSPPVAPLVAAIARCRAVVCVSAAVSWTVDACRLLRP